MTLFLLLAFFAHVLEDIPLWAPIDLHHHAALFLLKIESTRVELSQDH